HHYHDTTLPASLAPSSSPTRRSSDLEQFHFDPDTYLDMVRAEVPDYEELQATVAAAAGEIPATRILDLGTGTGETLRHVAQLHRSEEHTSELQSRGHLVCRLLLEKKT